MDPNHKRMCARVVVLSGLGILVSALLMALSWHGHRPRKYGGVAVVNTTHFHVHLEEGDILFYGADLRKEDIPLLSGDGVGGVDLPGLSYWHQGTALHTYRSMRISLFLPIVGFVALPILYRVGSKRLKGFFWPREEWRARVIFGLGLVLIAFEIKLGDKTVGTQPRYRRFSYVDLLSFALCGLAPFLSAGSWRSRTRFLISGAFVYVLFAMFMNLVFEVL